MAQSRFYLFFLSLTSSNLAFDVPFHSKRPLINGTVNLYHHRSFLWTFTVGECHFKKPSFLAFKRSASLSFQSDHLKHALPSALHSLLEGSYHFTVPAHAQVSPFLESDQSHFINCVTLALLHNLSLTQFPLLQNGNKRTVVGLNVKYLVECLAHGKCSICGIY